jgi:xylulokinase
MGGGYTIQWFQDYFAHPGVNYEQEAGIIPPGCQGLILVPYWNSVLGPYWDAKASGIIVGWRGIHTPAHLYRSILEGIAFEQRLSTSAVESATGQKISRYIAVGGGARSSLWCQIIANVTGKQVFRASTNEAAALGAGILASCAIGWYPDVRQAAQAMSTLLPEPYLPDLEKHGFYTRIFKQVYSPLFPTLRSVLDLIPECL